jgi:uncharacterized protein involved in exopolysaccharide biosynthesis
MNMLTHDHEARPYFPVEHSDFRAHYENVAARTLQSVRRHWGIIASCLALALALACSIIPLMPLKYSAVALIYPALLSTDQGKSVTGVSVDASSIVIGEARLVSSDAILQTVVKRLKLDTAPASAMLPAWVSRPLDRFRAMFLPETRNYSPFDRAVARLRNKVEVMKDTRSYLISISYTARSADEAAGVVNAVALEYLRDKALERQQDVVTAAENELARLSAIYGEKHPKVSQAADALNISRVALKAVMSPEDGGRDAIVTDDSVKLAIPNRTPTSPRGMVILGMAIMLGSLVGIGLAVWCDRRGLEPRPLQRDLSASGESDPPAPRPGREPDAAPLRRRRGGYSKRKTDEGNRLPAPENDVEHPLFPPEH